MEVINLVILSVLVLTGAVNGIALYFVIKFKKDFQNFQKSVQDTFADQADAFKKMTEYLDKEFNNNFEAHQTMQKSNEDVAEKLVENMKKLYETSYYIQGFLNKMAEGLGFRTKSNLEEI